MLMPRQVPPSRQGKKQVIAFLRPNQMDAIERKKSVEHKTNQEIIGDAINAVYEQHGMPPLVKSGHHRIVRRSKGRARLREEGTGPGCRTGRKSFGAWFDEDVVRQLNSFSSEINLPVQWILEEGVKILTGVAPQEDSDWLADLDRQEKAASAAAN